MSDILSKGILQYEEKTSLLRVFRHHHDNTKKTLRCNIRMNFFPSHRAGGEHGSFSSSPQ